MSIQQQIVECCKTNGISMLVVCHFVKELFFDRVRFVGHKRTDVRTPT